MAHDEDSAEHAMSASLGLADDAVGLVDLNHGKQLAAHYRGSSSAVTLARARVHSRTMSA